jgi:hypothetical protein
MYLLVTATLFLVPLLFGDPSAGAPTGEIIHAQHCPETGKETTHDYSLRKREAGEESSGSEKSKREAEPVVYVDASRPQNDKRDTVTNVSLQPSKRWYGGGGWGGDHGYNQNRGCCATGCRPVTWGGGNGCCGRRWYR